MTKFFKFISLHVVILICTCGGYIKNTYAMNWEEEVFFPFPCKSVESLEALRNILSSRLELYDLQDAYEVPENYHQFIFTFNADREHLNDVKKIYHEDQKFCFAQAITNMGVHPVFYTMRYVEGISGRQPYVGIEGLLSVQSDTMSKPEFRRYFEND